MLTRIRPIDIAEGERLAVEIGLPAATGRLLAFRAVAADHRLARGIFAQHLALRHHGRLSERLRELLVMRTAWRAGSAYEWGQHWNIAVAAGIGAGDLVALRDWRASDRFGPVERAVLTVVDDVFDHRTVRPAHWADCTEALGDPQLTLEVVAATNHWAGLAVLFRTLQLPLEPGMPAWPPDGTGPACTMPVSDSPAAPDA
ncbi:MAG: carboxymuconolactone decarboxylase family protein [Lautropia sp.]